MSSAVSRTNPRTEFVQSLERLGYVLTDGRRFSLTPRVLDLGYAYLASLNLSDIAQPYMEALVEAAHESSSISVLDGDEIVYVARVPTKRIMTIALAVGSRLPAHATSMGRVLLSALPPANLDDVLKRARLTRLTPRTVTDTARLRAVLAEVRAQGWALVDQELEEGIRSIAVPIHGAGGGVIAAMNVSAHATRVSLKKLREEFLPLLRRTGRQISGELARR